MSWPSLWITFQEWRKKIAQRVNKRIFEVSNLNAVEIHALRHFTLHAVMCYNVTWYNACITIHALRCILFANPPLYSNLISLKHTISIKIIIMSLSAISLFLLCQTVGNLSLNLISPDSSNLSQSLQISLYPNFLLVYPLAPPPSVGSAKKL